MQDQTNFWTEDYIINKYLLPSPHCKHVLREWPTRQNSQLCFDRKVLKIVYPNLKLRSSFAILYFHGNGYNVCCFESFFYEISTAFACDVYVYQYPKYGIRNKQEFTVKGVLGEVIEINKELRQKYEKVIVIGRSLGTGMAMHLAMNSPVAAVCLISPYKSYASFALSILPPKGQSLMKKMGFDFNNVSEIEHKQEKIMNPVLFLHGQDDKLIPPSNSRELQGIYEKSLLEEGQSEITAKAYSKLVILEGATHNNITHHDDTFSQMHKFFLEHQIKSILGQRCSNFYND